MPPKYLNQADLEKAEFIEICPGILYRGGRTIKNKQFVAHGFGEMKYVRLGIHYIGQWENGQYHGEGILIEPNRNKYTGGVKNSARHGWGQQETPSGVILVGNWCNDVLKDEVEIVYPDGKKVKCKPEELAHYQRLGSESRQGKSPYDFWKERTDFLAPNLNIQELLNQEESARLKIIAESVRNKKILDDELARIHRLSLLAPIYSQEIAQFMEKERAKRTEITQEKASHYNFLKNHQMSLAGIVLRQKTEDLLSREDIERSHIECGHQTALDELKAKMESNYSSMTISPFFDPQTQIPKLGKFGAIGESEEQGNTFG